MPLPDLQSLLLPILKIFADGNDHNLEDIQSKLQTQYSLSNDEINEPSNVRGLSKFKTHINLARNQLVAAKLLEKKPDKSFAITTDGTEELSKNPDKFDLQYLRTIPAYSEAVKTSFMKRSFKHQISIDNFDAQLIAAFQNRNISIEIKERIGPNPETKTHVLFLGKKVLSYVYNTKSSLLTGECVIEFVPVNDPKNSVDPDSRPNSKNYKFYLQNAGENAEEMADYIADAIGSGSQENKTIEQYLEEFAGIADKWFSDNNDVVEFYNFFKRFKDRKHLEQATWEDFQEMGNHIHAFNSMAIAKKNALGNPNHPIERYRDSFIFLVYGQGSDEERIRRFKTDDKIKLKYFGGNAISEIVGFIFADKYVLYNRRDKKALQFLGINLDFSRGDDFATKYIKYNDALTDLREKYASIVKPRTEAPVNIELDQFFSYIYGKYCQTGPVTTTQQYWICAPGRGADHWDDFYSNGIIAIGWDYLGDLTEYEDKIEIAERMRQEEDAPNSSKKNNAAACYEFANVLKQGDIVFAKKGRSVILGKGIVEGDYVFDDSREDFKHTRKVKWLAKGNWEVSEDKRFALKTLTNVTRFKDFVKTVEDLIGAPDTPIPTPTPVPKSYTLEDCARATGFSISQLEKWVHAINRKNQAVFYGPPGTGKTFISEHIARHLISGTDGILDFIQFHPAYSYEEFIQGIRPKTDANGNLHYELTPGRFVDFCNKARLTEAHCVLIIDEINRANLSRVFGELMYLLEYRAKDIPLSSGMRFSIPANVKIIGTMNTADRSIALVDFALRRRFAFLGLSPQYDILRKYQYSRGYNADGLIELLSEINTKINDKNFFIGISFFMADNLKDQLEEIWSLEIETYLEEYFFNQPEVAISYSWQNIQSRITSD